MALCLSTGALQDGKEIIAQQFASKRIAEIVIDLFVSSCLLSRVSSNVMKTEIGNL
ncbi:MAG: hypothetical protein R3A13_12145 [Bdellovibrionota bacterium]